MWFDEPFVLTSATVGCASSDACESRGDLSSSEEQRNASSNASIQVLPITIGRHVSLLKHGPRVTKYDAFAIQIVL